MAAAHSDVDRLPKPMLTMEPNATMGAETGHKIILQQLVADGFRFMFGNPGTVEEGFLDELRNVPELTYVLTLQESVAVMAADGYARATGGPALVQIHSTPGLGNAIGALYQAYRGGSPLIVLGGDAGVRYQAMDAQMAGDLVGMARPVTKWSTMVTDPRSLLRVLRRAIKVAQTPPTGPVYVCLPLDVLDAPANEPVRPTVIPNTRSLADPELLDEAASMLVEADYPMFYIGDGVARSEAQPELVRLAEMVGAEVWAVDSGEVNISTNHPLYQGMTGHMFGSQSKGIVERGDVNLICGTYMLPEVFPELGDVFKVSSKVIHIDLDAGLIAKNHPVDLGLVSDPKQTLAALADRVEQRLVAERREAARIRADRIGAAKEERVRKERERDRDLDSATPLHLAPFARALADALPADAVLFDEALTNSPALTQYVTPTRPQHYFQTRGGSLGVGFPGAIGAKLAHPDKTVVGVSGDGGAMYTIQAIWTAARHELDLTFVVCNNRSYRLLQANLHAYWEERQIAPHGDPIPFDLSRPEIDFVTMARSMGAWASRVETPEQIAPAIAEALEHRGPSLIEVVLEGDVHPELIGARCGQ